MGNWSLGSASDELFNLIPNIPTAISGNTLLGLIDRARFRIEDYTGQTVGSTGIAEKYQPALLNLSAANLLKFMHLQGGDMSIDNIRVGRSNLDSAQMFEDEGIKELQRLGMKTTIYKAFG